MTLSHRLQKSFRATPILPVAFIALLTADGVARLVQVRLGLEDRWAAAQVAMARGTERREGDPFHSTSADAILARNPFDSQAHAFGGGGEVDDGTAGSDPRDAALCDGIKVLAIVFSSDPDFSFAAFEEGKDTRSLLRRRGGEVGARTVAFIASDRVWMGDRGDQLCQALMYADEPPPVAVTPTPARPVVGAPGAALDPVIAGGIQRTGPTRFNVDRGIIPSILEKQAALVGTTHLSPELDQGKVIGLRLLGIRPESLLGTLGMESGDRLQTVNGFNVTTAEGALEAYARLQQADRLIVTVNRRGADTNLEYDIR